MAAGDRPPCSSCARPRAILPVSATFLAGNPRASGTTPAPTTAGNDSGRIYIANATRAIPMRYLNIKSHPAPKSPPGLAGSFRFGGDAVRQRHPSTSPFLSHPLAEGDVPGLSKGRGLVFSGYWARRGQGARGPSAEAQPEVAAPASSRYRPKRVLLSRRKRRQENVAQRSCRYRAGTAAPTRWALRGQGLPRSPGRNRRTLRFARGCR